MDITNTILYLSSNERESDSLPVKCNIIGQPKQQLGDYEYDRGIVLVKTEMYIDIYESDILLLVPKHEGYPVSRLEEDEVIFVYVLDGKPYLNKVLIDLSDNQKDILDWASVTLSYESAIEWQYKK